MSRWLHSGFAAARTGNHLQADMMAAQVCEKLFSCLKPPLSAGLVSAPAEVCCS
jgi:hypothetical protein